MLVHIEGVSVFLRDPVGGTEFLHLSQHTLTPCSTQLYLFSTAMLAKSDSILPILKRNRLPSNETYFLAEESQRKSFFRLHFGKGLSTNMSFPNCFLVLLYLTKEHLKPSIYILCRP